MLSRRFLFAAPLVLLAPVRAQATLEPPGGNEPTCITFQSIAKERKYIPGQLLREDIREDQDGVILEFGVGVIDTRTCTPLGEASVEIWNANAQGEYSSGDEHWLRGIRLTDINGRCEFVTTFPNAVGADAPRVHMRVSRFGTNLWTGEVIFENEVVQRVLALDAYQRNPDRVPRPFMTVAQPRGVLEVEPVGEVNQFLRSMIWIGVNASGT